MTVAYPAIRYMGSKVRLLPWIEEVLSGLAFESALDAFSGTGCVAWTLKRMGKRVRANDALALGHVIARALVANDDERVEAEHLARLLAPASARRRFIEETFAGIFYEREDLAFLDGVWSRLGEVPGEGRRALAVAALIRACAKRQPRGVFTVAGDPERYKDGRRDLALSLREHFVEQVAALNAAVFANGATHRAGRGCALEIDVGDEDLVYLDPPYVPRSDDNCYVKRYHFLEGLATYWDDGKAELMAASKVRKLPKRFTPFSYRRTAKDAFERLFERFGDRILVLSYASTAWPDADWLTAALERVKGSVTVHERPHRYAFGTHAGVREERTLVREYLFVAR